MLYDSDNFVVVCMDFQRTLEWKQPFGRTPIPKEVTAHGFEIVDKRTNMEVFLHDDWAGVFAAQIAAWQENVPLQDEVERILESYCELVTHPLVMH